MTDKWFINEDGTIYDYPEDEQALEFPNDFPEAYDTFEDAQAAQRVLLRKWCDSEFGEDHEHDANYEGECAWLMDAMSGRDAYDPSLDYPAYDYQTDHYERFGRPAFPNEY